jgi:conjugal transfer pilus assembly protein TraK
VAVSYSQPNRFSTPFESPRIIDASGADIQKDGSNIYIRPKDEMPFAVYVSGSNPGDPVISLFLIPKNIYPQTVILQLEDKNHPATSGGAAGNDEDRDASSYTGKLTNVLRDIALNKTPPGYSGGPLPKSVGRLFDLVVVPESRYSSSQYDVYVYWVEGTTKDTVHLDEKTFYSDGVRAVAFWPDVDVSLNHGTRVFVVSDVSGDDPR